MPDLLSIINKNVPEVFQTMASLTATPGGGEVDPPRPATLHGVTGSVSLSGKASGIVYTAYSQKMSKSLTMRVLGCDAPEEEEISDVVGE